MIEGRSSRDHEAIPQEPQKTAKQEPQIVMVIFITYYLSKRLKDFRISNQIFYDLFKYLLQLFIWFSDKASSQAQQHKPEGKSFPQKRSKSSKNYNVEHHVKGILNSFIVKGQHADKQQVLQFKVLLQNS